LECALNFVRAWARLSVSDRRCERESRLRQRLVFLRSLHLSLSLSLSRFSRVYFISDCCAKYFRQRGVPSLAPSLVDKRARLTGFSAFREFSPTSLRQALRNESGMSKSAWYSNYDYCIRRMQISSLVRSWRAYFLNRDRLKIG